MVQVWAGGSVKLLTPFQCRQDRPFGWSCRTQRKVNSMNKKLMMLVAGALAALAFTALPGAASAKETALKCESGPPCTFTVAGGVSTFSATPSGDTVTCTSVTGSGGAINLVNNETTTTQVALLFHGCRETATIFKFACSSPGTPSGTIHSPTSTAHLIALTGGTGNGVLLTNPKGTFTCAGGFARTTVTGNVIGEVETPCGSAPSPTQKLNFETTGHGAQKLKTYTGATFNLIGATNHNETPTATSGYETAAQSGTGTLTWNQNVQVTCGH
jgi:hypothetical protein